LIFDNLIEELKPLQERTLGLSAGAKTARRRADFSASLPGTRDACTAYRLAVGSCNLLFVFSLGIDFCDFIDIRPNRISLRLMDGATMFL